MIQEQLNKACRLIEENSLEEFKTLVSGNENLLSARIEESDYTLLHIAAMQNNHEAAEFLLESGAPLDASPLKGNDPDAKDTRGQVWTPLVSALNSCHYELAELIGSYGIIPKNLWVSVGLGRMDLVKSFFVPDGVLNDDAGNPGKLMTKQEILDDAYNMACQAGRREFIDFLLSKGANSAKQI